MRERFGLARFNLFEETSISGEGLLIACTGALTNSRVKFTTHVISSYLVVHAHKEEGNWDEPGAVEGGSQGGILQG